MGLAGQAQGQENTVRVQPSFQQSPFVQLPDSWSYNRQRYTTAPALAPNYLQKSMESQSCKNKFGTPCMFI